MALPNVAEALYDTLLAASGVMALVDDRIYFQQALQGAALPYVVFGLTDEKWVNDTRLPNVDQRWRVSAFAHEPSVARSIVEALYSALHSTTLSLTNWHNFDTKVHQTFILPIENAEGFQFWSAGLDIRIQAAQEVQRFVPEVYLSFNGVDLSAYVKEITLTTPVNLIEASAANDNHTRYLQGRRDPIITASIYRSKVGNADPGTVFYGGAEGTLVFGDQGTAVGKPKWEAPVMVATLKQPFSFETAVAMEVSFRLAGAWIKNYNDHGDTF